MTIQKDKSLDEILRRQALNLALKSSSAEINARLAPESATQPPAT